jgi:hypothetical protein
MQLTISKKHLVIKQKQNIMKHIILIFSLCLFSMSCKAQTPIVAIDSPISDKSQGTYFKDLNNELNKFEGAWVFTNGNTSLKIVLYKVEMNYDGSEFYFDDLRGEYQYIENGVEIINTLPNLESNPNDDDNRNILVSSIISSDERPVCNDCTENERRLSLGIIDPERRYLNFTIALRYLEDEDNPEKITATIFSENSGAIIPYDGAPMSLRVTTGEYLMQKQ